MTKIFFYQNQNKLQAITLGFGLISQKFGTLSQPGKSGLISSEYLFKASQRKDSYGTILAELCRTVGSTVVQNLEIFSDRVAVHFLRSNNSEFGALVEFIRNAIGSESAVSQTPPKQSIVLCKRLLQLHQATVLFRQECSCRFLCVGKRFSQVFDDLPTGEKL